MCANRKKIEVKQLLLASSNLTQFCKGDIIMQQLIISIIATISVLCLAVYEFLCVCRIIKKEVIVEKVWSYFFKDKPYNEKQIFLFIRPMILQAWFLAYVLSGGVASKILLYKIMQIAAIPLAAGALLRTLQDKN